MSYIDGTKESPSKSLYYKIETSTNKEGKETRSYGDALSPKLSARYSNRMSEYNRNNKRALGALKSIISLDNNNRFKDKIIAEDLYSLNTFINSLLALLKLYFSLIYNSRRT
jgi:hypothetical protein